MARMAALGSWGRAAAVYWIDIAGLGCMLRPARATRARCAAVLALATNFLIASAGIACNRAPGDAGAYAHRQRTAEAKSGGAQSRLHPGRTDITDAVDHRIDDVLCLGAAALLDHGETDLAGGPGDGVLRDATHRLQALDDDQRRRYRNHHKSDHHDER